MRIKSLAIRNIASIEKADIDFENDIRSFGDDHPASLFLISGDTGSGKTVILDCISMALYGTTPRVQGVSARKKNTFSIREGEEISLTDISQYTRMGISWKDECFSRLSFIGNDGKEYISTFSLGVTSHGNLRKTSWTLEIDGKELLQAAKKDEIKARIREAIGLSYHQFSRMAMLAQGEFADFLTGGKEEREKILEQLTNTGQFSRYGEAIERIFKRAKQEKEAAAALKESEMKHILMDDEEKALRAKTQELKANADTLSKEKSRNDFLITAWNNFLFNLDERRNTRRELKEKIAFTSSTEFQQAINNVKRWDATNEERGLLIRKREISKSLLQTSQTIQQLHSSFAPLSSDLDHRWTLLAESHEKEKKLSLWMDLREGEKNIFKNLSIVEEKCNSLRSLAKDIEDNETSLKRLQQRLPILQREREEAAILMKDLEKTIEEYRKNINLKSSQRAALNPEEISTKLQELSRQRLLVENSLKELNSYSKEFKELTEMILLNKELANEKELLEKEKKTADNKLLSATKEYEAADSRYTTMHLSVSENFNQLRAKLAAEHSHSCPLCGEMKDWAAFHPSKEDFSGMLSPLEKEREEALHNRAFAENFAKEAQAKYNLKAGELKSAEASMRKILESLSKSQQDIIKTLKKLSIYVEPVDFDKSIHRINEEILSKRAKLDEQNKELSSLAVKAEEIQKEINGLLAALSPLEENLNDKKKHLNGIDTDIKLTRQNCTSSAKTIESLKERQAQTISAIDSILKSKFADWQDLNFSFLPQLRKETEEYLRNVDALLNLKSENQNREVTLKNLEDIRRKVKEWFSKSLGIHKADTLDLFPQKQYEALPISTLSKEWNEFLASVSANVHNFISLNSELSAINNSLKDYYQESDSNEEALTSLLSLELSIPKMRERIEKTQSKIRSLLDAALYHGEKASKAFEELLSISETTSRNNIPSLAYLIERNLTVASSLRETLQLYGSLTDRLSRNDENKKNLAEVESDFEKKKERFEQWDALNRHFGGNRFRTLVQSYILRPLLKNANVYLSRITDRFTLTCSDNNEQLSILVLDRYNKNKVRSATVLSGGERFMISLALSLALSAMNKSDMNVDILFIDEGFGTLDAGSLNAVIDTLRRLPEIAGQSGRRVGVISHREELADRIDVKIRVNKCGEGRSRISIEN